MKLNPLSHPNAIVVDDFYANPDEVRDLAMAQQFFSHPKVHRGQRTHDRFLFPGLKEKFEQLMCLKITRWEEDQVNGVFQLCIAGDQVVYHSDDQKYAGVVYLTPNAPPEGGTSVYRSRANKMRSVQEAEKHGFNTQEAIEAMYRNKLFDPTAWEMVDTFGNVYNRLVIWDARVVHAATAYFGHNIGDGRLFQMFFFDAE